MLKLPDMGRAERLFASLREQSRDGEGVTRDAYGPGERAAYALIGAEAASLGLEVRTDHAGNLLMTCPGREQSAKRLVFGSHLDSVCRGGNYDGAAGVIAALLVLAAWREAGIVPRCNLVAVALRAEESGSWFPFSYLGSRAALGTLPAEALGVRRLDSGKSLAEHMRAEGFGPDLVRAGAASLPPAEVEAFIELHIEQGPLLEAASIPLGIVSGIPGSRRHRAGRVLGQTGHTGAVPRAFRHDAAIAAAELAFRLDEAWQRMELAGHRLVCTFPVLGTTAEAGFSHIAGEACFSLDTRSFERETLDLLHDELVRLAQEIAARRGVEIDLGPETASQACPMDETVRGDLAAAAAAQGIASRPMVSGGGHDAAAFVAAGVPAGMIFVRNQNGSHNPREAMRMEDFAAGCRVLLRFVAERAG